MKEYLLSAFGVIFFSVIISFIIPEGKTNKIILSIVRIICIFILIQPITQIFNKNQINSQTANFDYVCAVYSKNQSKQMEDLLLEKFNVESNCNIVINYDENGFKVEKTEITTINAEDGTNEKIYAYLSELGYINITVNE